MTREELDELCILIYPDNDNREISPQDLRDGLKRIYDSSLNIYDGGLEIVEIIGYASLIDFSSADDKSIPHKSYIDNLIATVILDYLPLAGGDMLGDIGITTGVDIKNVDVPGNALRLLDVVVALLYDNGFVSNSIAIDATGILLNATLVTINENLLLDSASGSVTISAIDGGWRHRIDGTDLVFERRESSVWTEKYRIGA